MAMMTVSLNGEHVQRRIDHVKPSVDGRYPEVVPVLRENETYVYTVGSNIPFILNLGEAYSRSRDSKYGEVPMRHGKPWGRFS